MYIYYAKVTMYQAITGTHKLFLNGQNKIALKYQHAQKFKYMYMYSWPALFIENTHASCNKQH